MKSALEIAHDAKLIPIAEIAKQAGILPQELEQYGEDRGKVKLSLLDRLASGKDGKVIIVTAITPTKAGEGKTTTSVALTMGLGKIKKKVMLCLREPSKWGPCSASRAAAPAAVSRKSGRWKRSTCTSTATSTP